MLDPAELLLIADEVVPGPKMRASVPRRQAEAEIGAKERRMTKAGRAVAALAATGEIGELEHDDHLRTP
jgi:hypothetical protein